ncbi:MAG TPA: carboxypeptidase-like regulatory domain-containing protein, partial [Terrimesophilobacter sp.]|nr:carboxypeptidase-like regulatory domain-containing protein [Terrimesophilobacter sp.]
MTTASTAPPATARFRRAVAALAALGVVAFGLVPASAAYAAESVTFRVVDSANNPVSSQVIVRHADGITTQGVTLTNGSPTNPLLLAPGDYTLETWDFTRFLHNEMPFTVEAGIPRDLGDFDAVRQAGAEQVDFVVDQFPAVTGTVPLDAAAAGVGVRAYRWDEDSSAWLQLNAWPYPVDPVDGSFTLWHYWDTDSTEFTLEFIADDGAPYFTTWLGGSTDRPWDQGDADTYALGAVNSVTDEGLTALVAAGIISGTVSDADSNPLEDASIWVHPDGDDSWGFSASTDSDGEYTVKVPLGDDYVAVAWASGFEDQYYDHVAELAGATPLSVTPITPRYSGIDFELNRVAELLVDVYADAGGVRQPLSVNGLLYREEGGSYSPIPFDWTYYEHSLDFDDLPQGTYRLGLQSVDETTWFPFSTIGLEPAGLGDTASACYLEFDVTGAEP